MLEAYLEGKRKKFPRMYFLSNPTLLKILSHGSTPKAIEDDFEKLFDAITKVTFGKSEKTKSKASEVIITHVRQMLGQHSEEIELSYPVVCAGNIEGWLFILEKTM